MKTLYASILLALVLPANAQDAASAQKSPIFQHQTEFIVASAKTTDFKPNAEEIDKTITFFDSYLSKIDRREFETAYAMQTKSQRAAITLERFKSILIDGQTKFGGVIERQLMRITWYPNRSDAPEPGTYVAMDFAAFTDKQSFQCGFVVLKGTAATGFQVVRTDSSFIPAVGLQGKIPRAEILKQLPCYLGPNIKTGFEAKG